MNHHKLNKTRHRLRDKIISRWTRFRRNKDSKATGDDHNNNARGPTKQLAINTILLKATGKAINKAVTTTEVVKLTIGDWHQETTLEALEIVDVWEPKEGIQKVDTRRAASTSIKLSRKIEDVDAKAAGYQKPIAQETWLI